ncbi:hypothetical protein HWV62_33843 [Athelia sp. TMB]|nr:hypothetical protein HWV62_33843 [Athelia sp. TMB]
MPRLPQELLNLVVEALAIPTRPEAYLNAEIKTLYNLCITSKTLQHFATPHLYLSIVLSTSHQLHSLVYSLRQTDGIELKRIRSLCLRDFKDALNEDNAAAMIQLLVLMSNQPSFSRLIIDRELRTWISRGDFSDDEEDEDGQASPEDDHEGHVSDEVIAGQRAALCAALEALPNLRDLHSIQDEVYVAKSWREPEWNYNRGWTVHRNLERVTIYNPIVDLDFTAALAKHPSLRQVIMVRPDADDEVSIEDILKPLDRWRELVIVGHDLVASNERVQALGNAVASLEHCCKVSFWNIDEIDEEQDVIRAIQLAVRDVLERGQFDDLPLSEAGRRLQ